MLVCEGDQQGERCADEQEDDDGDAAKEGIREGRRGAETRED